jgi:hypothetical protein
VSHSIKRCLDEAETAMDRVVDKLELLPRGDAQGAIEQLHNAQLWFYEAIKTLDARLSKLESRLRAERK